MHAGAPAVDQINAAVFVGADVVRLDRLLAFRRLRHVIADLGWTQRIAHVDRAQAGVEIGEKHEVCPRAVGRDVLDDVVGAEAAGAVEISLAVGKEGRDRQGLRLLADVDDPHELAVPVFLLAARLVGHHEIRPLADRPGGVVGTGKRRRPTHVDDELHLFEIRAVDHRDPAAPERREHAVAADHGRAVQGAGSVGRARIVAGALAVRLLPRQAPDAHHLGLERIAHVHGPDDAPVPTLGVVREERELARVVDPEAVRAAAGHVVKTDLARLGRLADIEDVESGTRVAPRFARQPLGIHIKNVLADDAQLVHVHARRRAELADLARFGRIAHVVDGETLGAVEARAADRAHVGVAARDLRQAAAAPGGVTIMAEQAEVLRLFGIAAGHDADSSTRVLDAQYMPRHAPRKDPSLRAKRSNPGQQARRLRPWMLRRYAPRNDDIHHPSTIFVSEIATIFRSELASCLDYRLVTPFATI